jgi:hypothetical protein
MERNHITSTQQLSSEDKIESSDIKYTNTIFKLPIKFWLGTSQILAKFVFD